MRAAVAGLVGDVRSRGDAALARLHASIRRRGARRARSRARPSFPQPRRRSTADQRAAINHAIGAVTRFHEAQVAAPIRVETSPGVVCERIDVPVHSVGLYVPAGQRPAPVDGDHARGPGPAGGLHAAHRLHAAARRRLRPIRACSPRRASVARPPCTRWAARRRSRRSPTARRPSRAWTRSSDRGTAGSRWPRSSWRPTPWARRSTCPPGRPKCW